MSEIIKSVRIYGKFKSIKITLNQSRKNSLKLMIMLVFMFIFNTHEIFKYIDSNNLYCFSYVTLVVCIAER